jgi:hypothetical protein
VLHDEILVKTFRLLNVGVVVHKKIGTCIDVAAGRVKCGGDVGEVR